MDQAYSVSDPLAAVLVVEDEPLIAEMMADVLIERGYAVYVFARAEDALTHIRSGGAADILFSDINLAGPMDGAELSVLARQLRPGMIVLLTSGRGAPAKAVSGADFVGKPYDPIAVARRLEALVRAAAPIAQAAC